MQKPTTHRGRNPAALGFHFLRFWIGLETHFLRFETPDPGLKTTYFSKPLWGRAQVSQGPQSRPGGEGGHECPQSKNLDIYRKREGEILNNTKWTFLLMFSSTNPLNNLRNEHEIKNSESDEHRKNALYMFNLTNGILSIFANKK